MAVYSSQLKARQNENVSDSDIFIFVFLVSWKNVADRKRTL